MHRIQTKYLVVFCLIMFTVISLAMRPKGINAAGTDYSVDLSTYAITDSVLMATQIVGNIAIETASLSNDSTSVLQTVGIYSQCDSTTTVTLEYLAHIVGENNTLQLSYVGNFATPMYLHDACFRKLSTSSSVQLNLHYR